MRKILLFCFFFAISSFSFAGEKYDIAKFQKKIIKNLDFNKDCQIDSLALIESDDDLNSKLQSTINTFGMMNIQDFDVGDCVRLSNFQNNIFTTHIWQNKNNILGSKVDLFVAYDISSRELLSVIVDQNKNAYVLGDNKEELKRALKTNQIYKNNFNGVNVDLSLNYLNFSNSINEEKSKKITNVEAFINKVQNGTFENKDCSLDNFNLLETDKKFKDKISLSLKEFGGLNIKEFDMGECLNSDSVTNGLLVTKFWQKNKEFNNNHLSLYIAYNVYKDEALLIILDDDEVSYLLGAKLQNLKNSLSNNKNLKDDYKLFYDISSLNFDDFKQKLENQKSRDKEIEKIKNPDWKHNCKKDRFTNDRSCFLYNKDLSIIYLNGRFGVVIGGNHFPGSNGSLKIDNNPTLNANEGKFLTNPSRIIDQLKNGKIAYTRYKKWPYEYNIDSDVKLNGFMKAFNEMLESYRRL